MATPDAPSPSPADLLSQIKPTRRNDRFLQAWDTQFRTFWFGCGDGRISVAINSKNCLATPKQGPFLPSRLTPVLVDKVRQGNAPAVQGADLLASLTDVLRKYVHLVDARLYVLFSLWIIGTHLYSMFSHYGYLFLYSKSKRCGKTRVLEVLHHLAFEASVPLNGPTVPAIRETVTAGKTILLDTIERWKSKSTESFAAAMELLDAGFRNGATVIKMEPDAKGVWHARPFPVYAPYALAAIEKDSLADTALDRSFVIEMERKDIATKKARYSHDDCERACAPLRDNLYLWALQNAEWVWLAYETPELDAELDRLELNDRAADIWKPLIAIARVLGVTPEVWDDVLSLAALMGKDEEEPDGVLQLAIVRALREELGGPKCPEAGDAGPSVPRVPHFLMTSELDAFLAKRGIRCSGLHSVLMGWKLKQKSKRLPGKEPRRVWAISDTDLARIENELAPS